MTQEQFNEYELEDMDYIVVNKHKSYAVAAFFLKEDAEYFIEKIIHNKQDYTVLCLNNSETLNLN